MPKWRVYVTGQLDYDYEVEASDENDAGSEAEEMFAREFSSIMWSGIDCFEVEEIDENES